MRLLILFSLICFPYQALGAFDLIVAPSFDPEPILDEMHEKEFEEFCSEEGYDLQSFGSTMERQEQIIRVDI